MTATDNAGNDFTRTIHYRVTDTADPAVAIDSPADDAIFAHGDFVPADYSCADEAGGSGIATCNGTAADGAPIDTSSFGQKTFAVTATDNAGNDFTRTYHYRVTDTADPTATIDSPADGASFARDEVVPADYSCADEAGGSGIATCNGTVADGAPIDTSSFGQKTFEVTATDNAGNDFTRTFHYRVTDDTDPSLTIDSPVDGADVPRGETVRADYSCTDEAGGSGLASCAGDVADGDPIDTSTLGAKTFSVTATDNAGNRKTTTVGYRVTDVIDPEATIAAPIDGAVFDREEVVEAAYACADEAAGSGVASCAGDVEQGSPIDTSTGGAHEFSVTATDNAGNDVTKTVSYAVRLRTADDPNPPAQRPDTEITRFKVNEEKRKLTATLASTPEGADFECRLDNGEFASCDSPVTLRKLSPGLHTFKARAMSPRGTPDQTPDQREFRILGAEKRS